MNVCRLAWILCFVWAIGSGCAGGLEPYKPRRPEPQPRPRQLLFPERTLLEPRTETAEQTLGRIESVFREIAEAESPSERGIRDELDAEVTSIRAAVDQLNLGAGAVMRLRLGTPTDAELLEFKQAASLHMRWALARMREGNADDRVRGAGLLEEARTFDPDDVILATVQATYLDMAGFRSNAIRALDDFERGHGSTDLIDLSRLRKHLRQWTLLGFSESIEEARALGERMVTRRGGLDRAPAWLLMEMARLQFASDSLDVAETLASRVVERAKRDGLLAEDAASESAGTDGGSTSPDRGEPFIDVASLARANLVLGLSETKRLEHERAAPYFAQAKQLAGETPDLEQLSILLNVPWDLWSDEDKLDYDQSINQAKWIAQYWMRRDPIPATPRFFENEIDYCARVAEAYLRFDNVDIRQPGPMTDPGRALLRFGSPNRWERLGSGSSLTMESDASFDFSVHMTWRFDYDWDPAATTRKAILFEDRSGGRGYFAAQDSLRPPPWPFYRFDAGFLGRAYPFDTNVTRFRLPGGSTRVMVSYDTVLPNYSVRFPMQGLRYEGEARVQSAIFRSVGTGRFVLDGQGETVLDRERTYDGVREFRRRSGRLLIDGVPPGSFQIPSFLRLRDESGRTLHVGVDNSVEYEVAGFGSDGIEASDILITSELQGIVQPDVERELSPGWIAYGPDPDAIEVWPRASRRFLPGEDLAYYIEFYNLAQR